MKEKKRQLQAPPGVDLNLSMTISLFIIILVFIIMLNALAVPDERRKRTALGSLNESFGILSGGSSVIEGSDGLTRQSIISEGSRLGDLNEMLKEKDGIAKDLVITGNKRRSTLSIPEHRLFKPGETELIPGSHVILDKISQIINKNKYPVDIMGYVDNAESQSGHGMSPRELSTLRAMALQSFFINTGKVAPTLLTAIGWGEFRPIASNQTRETRSLNRRMEIVFIHEAKLDEPEGGFIFKEFFFNVFEKRKNK